MAFHQRRDVTVLRAAQQIAFPMTRNSSVFRFRRSFADRDGIDDLTARLSADGCVSRAAHASLRPQVVHQLFFQYATRLNEEAAVNRLVGHSHARVIGELDFQPFCSSDQFRISLLATMLRNLRFPAIKHLFGRKAETQAWRSAS